LGQVAKNSFITLTGMP